MAGALGLDLLGAAELDSQATIGRLPHRYPLLMLDKIVSVEPGKKGVALKNVTNNEPHFQGHFPGNPVMPGVLILEALAQLGGIVAAMPAEADGADQAPLLGFLAGVDKAKFRKVARPGDQLRLEVEVLSARRTLRKIKGVASVDGQIVAEANITFAFDASSK